MNGFYDIAYLRPIPGFVPMAPKNENELQHDPALAAAREPAEAGIAAAAHWLLDLPRAKRVQI